MFPVIFRFSKNLEKNNYANNVILHFLEMLAFETEKISMSKWRALDIDYLPEFFPKNPNNLHKNDIFLHFQQNMVPILTSKLIQINLKW